VLGDLGVWIVSAISRPRCGVEETEDAKTGSNAGRAEATESFFQKFSSVLGALRIENRGGALGFLTDTRETARREQPVPADRRERARALLYLTSSKITVAAFLTEAAGGVP
jgi:hypothetical protein